MGKKFSFPQWLRPFIFTKDRDRSLYHSKITDLGFGIILIGLIVCGLTVADAWTRHVYKKNGVQTQASMLYWTSRTRIGAKGNFIFYTAHIAYKKSPEEETIYAGVETLLHRRQDVERLHGTENILYLPGESKHHVLFEKSLYPENFIWYQHWYSPVIIAAIGMIITIYGWVQLKIKRTAQRTIQK